MEKDFKAVDLIITALDRPFKPGPQKSIIKRFLPKNQVLILAPHPDDECLLGGLALRLKEENSFQVTACAYSLGSNPKRQAARKKEFKSACRLLNFKPHVLNENKESDLKNLIKKLKPQVIIASHLKDGHPTHIASAKLLIKVLKELKLTTHVFWGEYWQALASPNLMIELSKTQVKNLCDGLIQHKGEIERNPYHLRVPAWMSDNVRRGSEILGHFKESYKSDLAFALLYKHQSVKNGRLLRVKKTKLINLHNDLTDDIL